MYQAFEFSFSHKDRAKSTMIAGPPDAKGLLKVTVTPKGRKDKFMETSIVSSGGQVSQSSRAGY